MGLSEMLHPYFVTNVLSVLLLPLLRLTPLNDYAFPGTDREFDYEEVQVLVFLGMVLVVKGRRVRTYHPVRLLAVAPATCLDISSTRVTGKRPPAMKKEDLPLLFLSFPTCSAVSVSDNSYRLCRNTRCIPRHGVSAHESGDRCDPLEAQCRRLHGVVFLALPRNVCRRPAAYICW